MKRSKRGHSKSPSSSTPAGARHGMEMPNLFGFDARDSESDTDGAFQMSPLLAKHRLSTTYSPMKLVPRSVKAFCIGRPRIKAVRATPSPDRHSFGIDLSDKSIAKANLSDHLQHSLSYAKHMEQKAMDISTRINQTANLSMSPRILFASPDARNSTHSEAASEARRRASVIDDLHLNSFLSISRQTTSTVERFVKLADVCPDIINTSTSNRFLEPFVPGEYCREKRSAVINPIFNCNSLAGSFANIVDLSYTRLAVIYKARHRLSGLMYCLKRSRSDFEGDRLHANSSGETLNEVQALSLLQHVNIVRYYSCWFEADSIYSQLEYCLGGSLFHLLYPPSPSDMSESVARLGSPAEPLYHKASVAIAGSDCESAEQKNRLSERPLILLGAHIASALHYLHTTWSMVHGDVKPSNILIQACRPETFLASSKEGIDIEAKQQCHKILLAGEIRGILFKLSDFGRASRAGEDRDGEDLGDGRYLPRLNDPSPPAVAATGRDLYALGVTIYHSAGGTMTSSVWDRLRANDEMPDLAVLPNCLVPIVKALLRPSAENRPTATELINHELFSPFANVECGNSTPLTLPVPETDEREDSFF